MDVTLERVQRKAVNTELAVLGRSYHDSLPLSLIDGILTNHGFKSLEEGIYCGREGRVHEQVGTRTWLSFSWYKMDHSGRYEVTAYVS
jgi:hypothetical protein